MAALLLRFAALSVLLACSQGLLFAAAVIWILFLALLLL
jgi:hypothetical protein